MGSHGSVSYSSQNQWLNVYSPNNIRMYLTKSGISFPESGFVRYEVDILRDYHRTDAVILRLKEDEENLLEWRVAGRAYDNRLGCIRDGERIFREEGPGTVGPSSETYTVEARWTDSSMTLSVNGEELLSKSFDTTVIDPTSFELGIYQANARLRSITVGSDSSPVLDISQAIGEKEDYAAYLYSATDGFVDERTEVEAALSELEQAVDQGDITSARAMDAIDRLKLGESITEISMAGALPGTPRALDDTRFGVPGRETALQQDYNIAERLTKSLINTLVNLGFAAIALADLPLKLLKWAGSVKIKSSEIKFLAKEFSDSSLHKVAKWLLGRGPISESDYFLTSFIQSIDEVSKSLYRLAESGVITTLRFLDEKEKLVRDLIDSTSSWILKVIFEDKPYNLWQNKPSISESLANLTSVARPDENSEIDISGSRQTAIERTEYYRTEIQVQYNKTSDTVDSLLGLADAASVIGPMIEIAAYGLAIFTGGLTAPVGIVAGYVFDAVAGAFSAGAALSCFNGLDAVRAQHAKALDEIATGTTGAM